MLPLIKKASSVDLDVLPKSLKLISEQPAKYKLDLTLPFEVDDSQGSAKFDKSKNKLIVTLPVVPAKILPVVLGSSEEALVPEAGDNGEAEVTSNDDIPPLIEVLPEPVTETPHTNGHDRESDEASPVQPEPVPNDADEAEVAKKDDKKVFALPDLDFLQDDESVTLILDVKNAQRESIRKSFLSNRSFQLSVTSLGSGGFPMDWRVCVAFDEDCVVDETNSYVDVGPHNVVVTFVKVDESLGQWKKFSIGLNEDSLQVKTLKSHQFSFIFSFID